MSVRRVRLGDWCSQDRVSVRPGEQPNLRYVGLETVESNTGRLLDGRLSKTPDEPQANSFVFGPQHVLYGKLRPYLNKVTLPDSDGKCSTELIPLLPVDGLDRRYLAYFLRNPETVARISERTAGARMPRADMDFVLGLQMPLPELEEQRRIADQLSRAEGIVRLRRQARQKAGELLPAIFCDLFGDPAANPKGWPLLTLGELIATGPTNGLYKHKSAYGSGTPILRIDAFYAGRITDLATLKRVQVEPEERRRFALAAGDIIVNRVNSPEYLGKSALVPELLEPTVFESNMMRFSVDAQRALPEFVIALLQDPSSRRHCLANAKHAINQSSINQQDVKSLPAFAPPLELQRQFAQRVAAVLAIEQQQQAAMAKAEATFGALLARAFSEAGPQVHREMEKALA